MRRTEQRTKEEVISYIVRHGISSRKEIAEKIGVTNATLTHVTTELIHDGIIFEIGTLEEGKVGRKQVMLNIHEQYRLVVGFDVTNTSIRVTLLNIRADLLKMRRWDFLQLTQELLNEAMQYTKQLIDQYEQCKILGIGLLVQGYMRQDVCFSLPIQNIKQQLSAFFSQEIYMMNNVRGLAVAESYFENISFNYVIIKFGPGIGAVAVNNGEILEGYSGHAGELGHIVWDNKSEKKCIVCGKKGCLESLIGFETTIKKADPEIKVQCPDLQTLLKASEKDNGQALEQAIQILARAVGIFVDIIDPEKILLAGEIFKEDTLYQQFLSCLHAFTPSVLPQQICRIVNYSEKRLKAAGVAVLNEYFAKGTKSILEEMIKNIKT